VPLIRAGSVFGAHVNLTWLSAELGRDLIGGVVLITCRAVVELDERIAALLLGAMRSPSI
jgi:hypothetical protein